MLQQTTALRDELIACDNPVKWLNVAVRMAKRYGFTYCTLMVMPKPNDHFFSQLISASNLPNKLIQSFDKHALLKHCPFYATFAHSIQPQAWTLDDTDINDPNQMASAEALREHNLDCGILFSLSATNGERFILRFDGLGVRLKPVETNALLMDSIIAFDHFQYLRRNSLAVTKNLTKREIEVVKWTAQGKTSSEIAAILSLSDHTVNAYMNNAIKKLECVNRTQLVAKAIRMKLIS
jgi:DNA-binding CsgD family transcriptional regulator